MLPDLSQTVSTGLKCAGRSGQSGEVDMTNSTMPIISVITPCLNDAICLSEVIESFLAQDYPNKEIFVQDGGSTDGSHEILQRYPIRWSVAPDSGPHDAINKAIRATRGDPVVVMPANDLFAPGTFSRVEDEFYNI
jgi:glycosyltransferase involved in cell wall biosynthesis